MRVKAKVRQISGSVVVITGASSGIGRATALALAARRAKLVLAARDQSALRGVARACNEAGAQAAHVVPTDVRDPDQVRALREEAQRELGAIDTWMNIAGVYMMGSIEDAPAAAVSDVFSTNFFGVLHGIREALVAFRPLGAGVIISAGSLAGKVAYARASAYCASKHAVHALHQALHQELRGSGIHACLVAPGTVDTPLFRHAANYTGREIKAMPPVAPAGTVVDAILGCAERPRREVVVGTGARLAAWAARLVPAVVDSIQPTMVEETHLGQEGAADGHGNHREPKPPHAVDGGWRSRAAAERYSD